MGINVYEIVTERIIAELEKGIVPWRKPWIGVEYAWSRQTGKPYSLLNSLLLPLQGEYATYKQIVADGGAVNKGAKAKIVTFWSWIESKTEVDRNGNPVKIPFLKYYNVFHIETDTNLNVRHNKTRANNTNPIECAEKIINDYVEASGVGFHKDNASAKAFYSPILDSVTIPHITQYDNIAEYYSTAFHELVHSTGHSSRLNRDLKNGFGTEKYSKEELIAEIGAATILNSLGIENDESFQNSASYIGGWLRKLHDDKRLIVSASSKAEKAVRYINGERGIKTEEAKEVA